MGNDDADVEVDVVVEDHTDSIEESADVESPRLSLSYENGRAPIVVEDEREEDVTVRRGVSRVALLASQGKEVAEELKERVVTTVAPKVVNGKGKGEGCGNCTAIPLHDGDGDDGATMVKEETAHEDEGLQLTGLKSPEVRTWIERVAATLLFVITVAIVAGIVCLFIGGSILNTANDTGHDPIEPAQRWIDTYLSLPKAENIRAHLKYLSSESCRAGTEEDYERTDIRKQAEYVRDEFTRYGLNASIIEYEVLLSSPVEQLLEIVGENSDLDILDLTEPPIEEDESSQQTNVTPTYNAYAHSGDVTARVVYANYGRVEDFKALKERNISIDGHIVLVRYGKIFRGTKVMIAEENNASAVLIYTDPADDGDVLGEAYPSGPYRPRDSVQRGSTLFIGKYSGDPSTPFYPSRKGSERLSLESVNIPSIPVQPISANNADKIMAKVGGEEVMDESWIGGLHSTYRYGAIGTGALVHLKLVMDTSYMPIWDVVGVLEGKDPKHSVVMGNHRDAWVFGAVDPHSGGAPMIETARALGEMHRMGWTPERSIVVCSWDAEEFGLVGSVEWVEENAAWLSTEVVAYVNTDMGAFGPDFQAEASSSFGPLIRWAAKQVKHPRPSLELPCAEDDSCTVFDDWMYKETKQYPEKPPPFDRGTVENPPPLFPMPEVAPLGSGSDYTPFLQHVGIPAMDLSFSGPLGNYHSIYDTFHWIDTFGDPQQQMGEAIAKMAGLIVVALSDAPLLPFDYVEYAVRLDSFVRDIRKLEKKIRAEDTDDEKDDHSSRERDENRALDFSPLLESVQWFQTAGVTVHEMMLDLRSQHRMSAKSVMPMSFRAINHRLMMCERKFLFEGVPERPWYRHSIYAPGLYGGYEASTLPSIREAIEAEDWEMAQYQIENVAATVLRAAMFLLDDQWEF